jgi:hypothetical protein
MRLRGVLASCLHPVCPGHEPYLPPASSIGTKRKPSILRKVAWEGPAPLRALLRRVPTLEEPRWDAAITYRAQFRAAPAGSRPAGVWQRFARKMFWARACCTWTRSL